jgi:hypothetical protein
MKNQGKTDKQIKNSEAIAVLSIIVILWIVGYLIIFN